MTYDEAFNRYSNCNNDYQEAISNGRPLKEILNLSGRRLASLQALEKIARKQGHPDYGIVEAKLKQALLEHKRHLKEMDIKNKEGEGYSIITELSVGAKTLVNAVKRRKYAYTEEQEKQANKEVIDAIGQNLKNIVKAPIALTTKILKEPITAIVFLAPVGLFMGILHAAWEAMDDKKTPFDTKPMTKLSSGLTNVLSKVHHKVQKI